MLVYSFLGILTLQLGVAVLSCIFFTLAALMVSANFFDMRLGSEMLNSYILLGLFIVLMIIAGLLMFCAAYKESRTLCIVSAVLVVIILIIFLIASIVSLMDLSQNVCTARHHCAETLWLSRLNYKSQPGRDSSDSHSEYDYTAYSAEPGPGPGPRPHTMPHIPTTKQTGPDIYINPTEASTTPHDRRRKEIEQKLDGLYVAEPFSSNDSSRNASLEKLKNLSDIVEIVQRNRSFLETKGNTAISKMIRSNLFSIVNYMREPSPKERKDNHLKYSSMMNDDDDDDDVNTEEYDEPSTEGPVVDKAGFKFGIPFIMSVILFIINAIFFLFTIVVLWSHGTQLKYIKEYLQDPASRYYLRTTHSI